MCVSQGGRTLIEGALMHDHDASIQSPVPFEPPVRRRRNAWVVPIVLLLSLVVAGGVVWVTVPAVQRHVANVAVDKTTMPDVDRSGLTPRQVAFLDVAERELKKQPDGTTYSDGKQEPWCANFVSFVMAEIGVPLKNPHSGGTRIPGVYTLTEHLQGRGVVRQLEDGYAPKTGDIVLYDKGSTFDRHTNFVVTTDGEWVWTVGGNEHGRIEVSRIKLDSVPKLLGVADVAALES